MSKDSNPARSILVGGVAAIGLTCLTMPVEAQSIEELRQQVQALSRRIEQLEAQQRTAGEAAEREAQVVESGGDTVRLSLSGQVNRGILYGDNGTDSQVFHVDNTNSSTRFRIVGEADLNDDITVGSQIEVEMESNASADVSFNQTSATGGLSFTERKLEVYFDSDALGRLWVGQGDTASNGTSEVDLSGTAVVGYSSIASMAGGLEFQDFGARTGVRIKEAHRNLDGLSRDDRLRYDTPNFGGFTVSASAVEADKWDAALRFSGDVSGVRLAAAVAYADGLGIEQVNGSASVLLPSGFNVTGAAGQRSPETGSSDDDIFWYAKLGQRLDLFDIGRTALAVDYTESENYDVDGDKFTSYGLFLVQNLDPAATELYLGVRNHELDAAGSPDPDDVFAVLTGARLKF